MRGAWDFRFGGKGKGVLMSRDRSLGMGVYYEMDDYAGFVRRVMVVLIDLFVVMVMGTGLWGAIVLVSQSAFPKVDPSGIFLLLLFVLIWCYLVPLKRSRFGTVAYWLLNLKIVTTKGQRPSLFIMTFRMMMWMFGPFNFFIDLIWLGADTECQSLRDCFAGTYVVRKNANPIGQAAVHLTRYTGAGLTLAYPRVCRPTREINRSS